MKITYIIKKSVKRSDYETKATIYLRMRDGRRLDSIVQTRLSINPNLWDEKNECVKTKAICNPAMRNLVKQDLRNIKSFIENEYVKDCTKIDKGWLRNALQIYYNPNKYTSEGVKKQSFGELFDEFLVKHKISEVLKKNFRVAKRSMLRYEAFTRKRSNNPDMGLLGKGAHVLQNVPKYFR